MLQGLASDGACFHLEAQTQLESLQVLPLTANKKDHLSPTEILSRESSKEWLFYHLNVPSTETQKNQLNGGHQCDIESNSREKRHKDKKFDFLSIPHPLCLNCFL